MAPGSGCFYPRHVLIGGEWCHCRERVWVFLCPLSFITKRIGLRLDLVSFAGHDHPMTLQTPVSFPNTPQSVHFHRTELSVILSLYGRMVAAGEWRDYAISSLRDAAIFSVFRRTAEHPLYRIEKRPKLANRQGQYVVLGMDGQILKRGNDLKTVLRVLERKLIRAVDLD